MRTCQALFQKKIKNFFYTRFRAYHISVREWRTLSNFYHGAGCIKTRRVTIVHAPLMRCTPYKNTFGLSIVCIYFSFWLSNCRKAFNISGRRTPAAHKGASRRLGLIPATQFIILISCHSFFMFFVLYVSIIQRHHYQHKHKHYANKHEPASQFSICCVYFHYSISPLSFNIGWYNHPFIWLVDW